jgi:predicted NodU family carbamoyl transferase
LELSHHLAHAYSTATQSPFDKGMVVVMDGMGETYRTMLQAEISKDPSYISDFSFGTDSFTTIPSDLAQRAQQSRFDWREAESVYVFEKKTKQGTILLKPIFKRFTQEHSPPALYNHGFENMDSVGALYSRASSHIFGDWNACGKVMGLAPWIGHSWTKAQEKEDNDIMMKKKKKKTKKGEDGPITPRNEESPIMWGSLYSEEEGQHFQVDRSQVMGMPLIARMDSDMFDNEGNLVRERRYDFDDNTMDSEGDVKVYKSSNEDYGSEDDDEEVAQDTKKLLPTKVALDAITLAYRIQVDLENIVMDFVKHYKQETGEANLCIAGGVGLNSVLNGRLSRELGFEQTFISPYPGDDGIAVGCCAYGLFGNEILDAKSGPKEGSSSLPPPPPLWTTPLSPYLGPDPSESAIKAAIDAAAPWLEFEAVRDDDRRVEMIALELESGSIVAWYQGRSEMGPRALGHRSILADPRKKSMVRFINQYVKKRESFRPFAPSVLAEYATEWFDMGEQDGDNDNKSPYMSLTAMVHEDKRHLIPAVTHVDGSSRLQTVTAQAESLYHKLISKFYELTGVPLLLNTSFNIDAPITESPEDAIRTFLCSKGAIEFLVMGDYIIKRKLPNLRVLLGEAAEKSDDFDTEPGYPCRAGRVYFESKYEFEQGETEEETMETKTRVRMPGRPMHQEKNGGWFDLMDEFEGELLAVCDGTVSLNDILAQYTAVPEDEEMSSETIEDGEALLQDIVHRLVRLYENTLISW